jgi:heme/copper-type cytochrome/quinol oxidase subunit 2
MCSELCGIDHGFMPISLKVYSFDKWGANIEYITNPDNVSYSNIVNFWYV